MSDNGSQTSLLVPGRNCWKVEKADKVALLIDADSYYRAFREAVKKARKTVFISGWDIDSRLELLREDPGDGYPTRLRDFLNAAAEKNQGLQIFILVWDFAMLIGMDREWFPIYKLDWKTHENVRLAMDDLHPVGASHHHKLVIIDDSLAFAGGLDFTKNRWDTMAHKPDDQRRRNTDGDLYRPHHDVQIMVFGKGAAHLGDFFRQRWEMVSSRPIPGRQDEAPYDIWPDTINHDIRSCHVGIARTRAPYKNLAEIREVEKLYLDTINQAEKYIYIENQYLTSPKIAGALKESLRQENGPEIIIVLPATTDGWLSQYTMDLLRNRALSEMQEADQHHRLGIFYAHQAGLEGNSDIKVHAKLMIADDILLRVGSSNLNNRSMGLDTEIDLAVEAEDDPEQKKAVSALCSRLLAEHLGIGEKDFQETLRETGSWLAAIKKLQNNERTLKNLEPEYDETVEKVAEEQYLLDPEKPIEPENLIEQWLPVDKIDGRGLNRIGFFIVLLVGAAALALAWRFTPLHDMISGEQLLELVNYLKTHELAWLYVSIAYVCGSILVIPITGLITLTILIYGTVKGIIFALLGSVISGAITYWLGRMLGRNTVRKLAGDKINRISKRLGKSGIFSTFIIRLMPIAPYSIVNIVAGASHIRFWDFMLGTVLGMLPGTLAIAGLIDRGFALFTNPSPLTIFSLIAVGAAVAAGYFFMQKKLSKQN